MTSITTDLTMTRGETPTWDIACTRDGAPVDLTGATIQFAAKYEHTDAAAVISHAVGSGIVITNAAGGLCALTLAAADTTEIAANGFPAELLYDVRVTEQDGNVTTVASGTLTVEPSVV